jgi:photosystem II stability/assembly factor-like uncharacterized protein
MTRTAGALACAAALLALTACGSHRQLPAAEKTLAPGQGGVVLADGGQAVLLGTAAHLSTNGGQSWSALRLPATPATGSSIATAAGQLDAVTVDADGMALQRSTDGGQSWHRTPLALSIPTDRAAVAISSTGRAAVLASATGSANNGDTPELFVQNADGTLTARQAPVSGSIAWSGHQLLIAGGPLSSRLYVSTDDGASWTARAVGGSIAPRFDVAPDTPSIGTPLTSAGGSAVSTTVPVTDHAGAAAVRLISLTGSSPTITVPLSSTVGPGAVAVVSTAGPDGFVVAEPGSSMLHLITASGQQSVIPRGLPGPVDALSFSDAKHGIAQLTVRSCNGKQDCTEQAEVLGTADGGRSWSAPDPAS